MFAILLTVLITFFISSLFGYCVHISLHQEWSGHLHQMHMKHHNILYPPNDYMSDKYRNPGQDNTVVIFAVSALPVVASPIILGFFHIIPWVLVVASLIVMVMMSFLHNYLHDAFHIRNHWLYGAPILGPWFFRLVQLHWLHHIDQGKNYGIFIFHWDHILGTFWSDK
jgi:sterol desaturase/sphingolipid hydroxylase (fatty acid hydroxylase superfamily)